jgi:hypothetical protein
MHTKETYFLTFHTCNFWLRGDHICGFRPELRNFVHDYCPLGQDVRFQPQAILIQSKITGETCRNASCKAEFNLQVRSASYQQFLFRFKAPVTSPVCAISASTHGFYI